MAGHSKWANIKHRKSMNDAKKSKMFSKLSREITAAAKQGDPTPATNPRLRLAIQNAKGVNLPKDTIERAIQKGRRGETAAYKTVVYEGYALHGVAVIVTGLTDNLNRTLAAVRAIFTKHGGSLTKKGSLAFLFALKGVFTLHAKTLAAKETWILSLIDTGIEDITLDQDYGYVTCQVEKFGQLQKHLAPVKPIAAALHYVPHTLVTVAGSATFKVLHLLEALEAHEDVQYVYHNMAPQQSQA